MSLARLIAGHICLHACMAGTRLAAPLLALKQGYSPLAVGVLLALFALTQVFLALPAGPLCRPAWAQTPGALCRHRVLNWRWVGHGLSYLPRLVR